MTKLAETSSEWDGKTLARFWKAMGEMFGRRWFDEYGNEPPMSWKRELERMTPNEAALGIQALRDSGAKHPPTLPHFFKLAKQSNPYHGQRNSPEVAKLHAESAARAARELPEPDEARLARMKAAPDVAKAALEEMRGLLK